MLFGNNHGIEISYSFCVIENRNLTLKRLFGVIIIFKYPPPFWRRVHRRCY